MRKNHCNLRLIGCLIFLLNSSLSICNISIHDKIVTLLENNEEVNAFSKEYRKYRNNLAPVRLRVSPMIMCKDIFDENIFSKNIFELYKSSTDTTQNCKNYTNKKLLRLNYNGRDTSNLTIFFSSKIENKIYFKIFYMPEEFIQEKFVRYWHDPKRLEGYVQISQDDLIEKTYISYIHRVYPFDGILSIPFLLFNKNQAILLCKNLIINKKNEAMKNCIPKHFESQISSISTTNHEQIKLVDFYQSDYLLDNNACVSFFVFSRKRKKQLIACYSFNYSYCFYFIDGINSQGKILFEEEILKKYLNVRHLSEDIMLKIFGNRKEILKLYS